MAHKTSTQNAEAEDDGEKAPSTAVDGLLLAPLPRHPSTTENRIEIDEPTERTTISLRMKSMDSAPSIRESWKNNRLFGMRKGAGYFSSSQVSSLDFRNSGLEKSLEI